MKKMLLGILLFVLIFSAGCATNSQQAEFYSINGEKVASLKVSRFTFMQYSTVQANTDTFGMTAEVVGTSKPDTESIDALANSSFADILKALVVPAVPIPVPVDGGL